MPKYLGYVTPGADRPHRQAVLDNEQFPGVNAGLANAIIAALDDTLNGAAAAGLPNFSIRVFPETERSRFGLGALLVAWDDVAGFDDVRVLDALWGGLQGWLDVEFHAVTEQAFVLGGNAW